LKQGTDSANFAGVYFPNFGQISVKFSVFGVLYPYRCTDHGGEIWHGGVWLRSTPPRQISPPPPIGETSKSASK